MIVPVFNTEQYIDACVESIVAQSYRNLEIILVDDGSVDASPEKCDEWAKRDSRVRVYHKNNGGSSDAKNYGVRESRGQYVGFVDSDDRIDPDMYDILLNNILTTDTKLAICGIRDCYQNDDRVPGRTDTVVLDAGAALKECLIGNDISVNAVTRLYARELLGETPFPVGRTTEDGFTFASFIMRAGKVVVDYRPLYYYEHHEGTVSTRPYSASSYDVVDAYEEIYRQVVDEFPTLKEVAQLRRLWSRFVVLDSLVDSGKSCDEETYKKVIGYLRNHYLEVLRNPYFTTSRKIAMMVLKLNDTGYSILRKIQRRKLGFKA